MPTPYCPLTGTCELDMLAVGAPLLGFVLQGEEAGDQSGSSLSSAGDINGDGLADILIGALVANSSEKVQVGKSYLVFGARDAKTWGSSVLNLNSLMDGRRGFVLQGEEAHDWSGCSVSSAGDINGDGLSDILVGACKGGFSEGPATGKVYLVFGSNASNAWGSGVLTLSNLTDGRRGFVLQGEITSETGISVSNAGDINGDGLSDMLVGADIATVSGKQLAGKAYLIFGSRDVSAWGSGKLNLTSLADGQHGFVVQGEADFDQSGFSVSTAGDINGDGLSEILVGAPASWASAYRNPKLGKTYVLFGSNASNAWGSGVLNLSNLTDGRRGFVLQGEKEGDRSGVSVGNAGDVNGDGLSDILIGAPGAFNSTTVGKAYVIFGSNSTSAWSSGSFNLSSLMDGRRGFILEGETVNDHSGISVSNAGDTNGDGFGDILVGSENRSYVVLGNRTLGSNGTIELSNLDGSNGFKVNKQTNSTGVPFSVASAGDIDGDNVSDIITGDWRFGNHEGRSYLLFGNRPRPPSPQPLQPSNNLWPILGVIGSLLIAVLLCVAYWCFKKKDRTSLGRFENCFKKRHISDGSPLLPVQSVVNGSKYGGEIAALSEEESKGGQEQEEAKAAYILERQRRDLEEQKDVTEFLGCIASGKQNKAESMLKKRLGLALCKGNIRDPSGREFKEITGFQYTVWALDWHMWKMLLKYMSPEAAVIQFQELEEKGTAHGKHFSLEPLIKALDTYVQGSGSWDLPQCQSHWRKEVGGNQLLLPVGVVNEYCHPSRDFVPTPGLDEAKLERSVQTNVGPWYTAFYNGGNLGKTFGYCRSNQPRANGTGGSAAGTALKKDARGDREALKSLLRVGEAQLQVLRVALSSTRLAELGLRR